MEEQKQLTYAEAYKAMQDGKKVRLSDWAGYWFMEHRYVIDEETKKPKEGKQEVIMVFTRDGDILFTPFIERYKERTDWEITDGKMGFDFAIRALKSGKKVCREGWNGKGMWLYLVPGSTFQVAEGRPLAKHLPIGETVTYHSHIDMKTVQDTHVPWLASQTDMLAEDWQVA